MIVYFKQKSTEMYDFGYATLFKPIFDSREPSLMNIFHVLFPTYIYRRNFFSVGNYIAVGTKITISNIKFSRGILIRYYTRKLQMMSIVSYVICLFFFVLSIEIWIKPLSEGPYRARNGYKLHFGYFIIICSKNK